MNCRRATRQGRLELCQAAAVMVAFLLANSAVRAAAQMPTAADAPTIEKVIIDQGGQSLIEGEGRPGDLVEIVAGGVVLGKATVARGGRWRIDLKTGLKAGTYLIRAEARAGSAGAPTAGDEIRVAIPSELGGRAEVQYDGTTGETERATRQRAETLARDAGQAFDEITRKKDQAVAAAEQTPYEGWAHDGPEPSSHTPQDGPLAVVIEWLKRSAKTYRDEVVQKLRAGKPDVAAADPTADPSPTVAGDPVVPPKSAAQATTASATERAEAEARRLERSKADAERQAATELADQRDGLPRKPSEDRAAKTADADRRIAAELERLKTAREDARSQAGRIELAQADAERKAEQQRKAAEEAAQRSEQKRRQAEELARKKAEADKRIAEELERLKKAREDADRAKARKDAAPRSDNPQQKATITLERFFLPGEKRPREETTTGADALRTVEAADPPKAGRCLQGRVVHRKGRRWYLTGADDTLWDIAERFYGSGLAYQRIYRANRKRLSSPHIVRPCLTLRLPGRR